MDLKFYISHHCSFTMSWYFSEEGFPDPTPPASSESKPTVKKWEKPRNRAGEKPTLRKRGKGARKVKSYTVGEGQFKVNNQQEEKELVRRKRSHVCITTHCIAYYIPMMLWFKLLHTHWAILVNLEIFATIIITFGRPF